jgi:uncharacterized protein YjdB
MYEYEKLDAYETRVRDMEALGMTRSDAQAVIDAEDLSIERNQAAKMKLTDAQRNDLIDLLWASMRTDPAHRDRKQTGWGTKTQHGLLACIERIVASTGESVISDKS